MPLIQCPDCNKDVSDMANSCIHCGRPLTPEADNNKDKFISEHNHIYMHEKISKSTSKNKKSPITLSLITFFLFCAAAIYSLSFNSFDIFLISSFRVITGSLCLLFGFLTFTSFNPKNRNAFLGLSLLIVTGIFAYSTLYLSNAIVSMKKSVPTKAERDAAAIAAKTMNNKSGAWVAAKLFVKEKLKAPATADFPWSDPSFVTPLGNNRYQVVSYVDAQNSFGAKIRTNFSCIVREGSGTWHLENMRIDQ